MQLRDSRWGTKLLHVCFSKDEVNASFKYCMHVSWHACSFISSFMYMCNMMDILHVGHVDLLFAHVTRKQCKYCHNVTVQEEPIHKKSVIHLKVQLYWLSHIS